MALDPLQSFITGLSVSAWQRLLSPICVSHTHTDMSSGHSVPTSS